MQEIEGVSSKMAQSEFMNQGGFEHNDILINQFDTRAFLENLSRILRGRIYDHDLHKEISVREKGFLNELGARQVLNEVEGRIQNINSSAYMRRGDIASIREDIWFCLTEKLYINAEKYELSFDNLDNILYLIDHNIYLFLSRTEESGFFNKLSNFFNRKETYVQQYSPNQEEQKKRRFSV